MTIQRAIDDVAQTVGRMREFYRPREPEQLGNVDLNPLVQQVVDLTRARWNDHAATARNHDRAEDRARRATCLPFAGPENEIRDALTNLIFNAVDAHAGGRLDLHPDERGRVRGDMARHPTRASCWKSRTTASAWMRQTRRRCLEPFFTTKGERGTGMGLAMVYGMAQRHGAELEIDSEPGVGTTIRLVLPARRRCFRSQRPAAKTNEPLRAACVFWSWMTTRSCWSLCVSALREEGHDVTAADGGQAGIDAFRSALSRREPFDIVITDLGMPHVDGRQVAESVRAASPRTPIILLTGWGQNVGDGEPAPPVDRLLAKPPRLRELRAALAELTSRAADEATALSQARDRPLRD